MIKFLWGTTFFCAGWSLLGPISGVFMGIAGVCFGYMMDNG